MKLQKKSNGMLLFFLLVLPVLVFVSMNAGYSYIPLSDILRVLAGGGTAKENLLILGFRLPRIVIAMLVGAGFAVSGCIIQGVTKNPLADPGLMGINSGAGLMVVIFVVMKGTFTIASIFFLPVLSLLGSSITALIIYLLASRKGEGLHPVRLVLNGVALQAGINAAMTLLVLKMDERQYDFIASWQAGSIWSANWKFVITLLPWIIVGLLYLFLKSRILDVLSAGDEIACGLGVNVRKEKFLLLFAAVALSASSVAVSGNVNFVGLVAPHLARRLTGVRHRILIPASALLGAILVLVSDTVARTIIKPTEIPTGIVVSILGAPYFIHLLIKSKGNFKGQS